VSFNAEKWLEIQLTQSERNMHNGKQILINVVRVRELDNSQNKTYLQSAS